MTQLTVDNEIKLLPVHESFAEQYAELAKADYAYLCKWLHWPRVCHKPDDFKNFILDSQKSYAEGTSMLCAIDYQGKVIGNAGFKAIDQELSMAEIGYWIASDYQGKGIVTRICQYLIDYAFSTLNISKVQISVAENNSPSRAVCERLGMKLEGIITNSEKVGNQILDHAIYGIHKAV